MRRREFIILIGGVAAAWPLAARAQQAMPVIGFLDPRSPHTLADQLRAFRQGLKDTGYVEGENVSIEYRWAEGQYDRLPTLAAELVRRRVAVIATNGGPATALAATGATATTPIVCIVGEDPVRLGLVSSLGRPGGNLTGINFLIGELTAKRLGLLREFVPGAARIAVLVNPSAPAITEQFMRALQAAAPPLGMQLHVMQASTDRDLDTVFATMRADALVIARGTTWRTVAPLRGARDLHVSQVCRRRRSDELRTQ